MDDAQHLEDDSPRASGNGRHALTLTASQWAESSLCGGWSVRVTAAHIVMGSEQNAPTS